MKNKRRYTIRVMVKDGLLPVGHKRINRDDPARCGKGWHIYQMSRTTQGDWYSEECECGKSLYECMILD